MKARSALFALLLVLLMALPAGSNTGDDTDPETFACDMLCDEQFGWWPGWAGWRRMNKRPPEEFLIDSLLNEAVCPVCLFRWPLEDLESAPGTGD